MSTTLCAVVLAAGQGSRYRAVAGADQDKLLAPCVGRDGVVRPVLEQVLLGLQAAVDKGAVDNCVLLTRPERLEVIELGLRYGCQVELLASGGMGDSIAAAVTAHPEHRGWLVVLGDMPFILPDTLIRVMGSLEDGSISVPVSAINLRAARSSTPSPLPCAVSPANWCSSSAMAKSNQRRI